MGARTAARHYQDPPSDEVPTLSEIAAAVNALKNYKAAGVCGISPGMIKYGGQDGLKMLHILIVSPPNSQEANRMCVSP